MIKIIKTDASNKDFKELVKKLDADLAKKDGDEHAFYDQFNKIDAIKFVVVAYENEIPLGCGAIKKNSEDAMEIKRMYVSPEHRAKGIATKILSSLESWAAEMQFAKCVLETGKRQPDAIALYTKNGYRIIKNFGQYANVENSVCFEKIFTRA